MTLSSTAARLLAMVAPALMMGGSLTGFGTEKLRDIPELRNAAEADKTSPKANRLADVSEARILRMFGMGPSALGGYRTGPGWSQRQVQRMARKKRNQARNKRAHRG